MSWSHYYAILCSSRRLQFCQHLLALSRVLEHPPLAISQLVKDLHLVISSNAAADAKLCIGLKRLSCPTAEDIGHNACCNRDLGAYAARGIRHAVENTFTGGGKLANPPL